MTGSRLGGWLGMAGTGDCWGCAIAGRGLRVTVPGLACCGRWLRGASGRRRDRAAVRAEIGSVSTQAVYDVLRALDRRRAGPRARARRVRRAVRAPDGDNHHHVVCRACGADRPTSTARRGRAPCLTPHDDRRLRRRRGRGDLLGPVPCLREPTRPDPRQRRQPCPTEQAHTDKSIATPDMRPTRFHDRHRRAGGQRPQLPHDRRGRPDPAARRALPRTRWRTSTASGSRSATCTPRAAARSASSRPPRTSAAYTKAALFQPGVTTEHAGALLDRGRRAGLARHLARPARLRAEVLHDRGQLRPRRQQHARSSSSATR